MDLHNDIECIQLVFKNCKYMLVILLLDICKLSTVATTIKLRNAFMTKILIVIY